MYDGHQPSFTDVRDRRLLVRPGRLESPTRRRGSDTGPFSWDTPIDVIDKPNRSLSPVRGRVSELDARSSLTSTSIGRLSKPPAAGVWSDGASTVRTVHQRPLSPDYCVRPAISPATARPQSPLRLEYVQPLSATDWAKPSTTQTPTAQRLLNLATESNLPFRPFHTLGTDRFRPTPDVCGGATDFGDRMHKSASALLETLRDPNSGGLTRSANSLEPATCQERLAANATGPPCKSEESFLDRLGASWRKGRNRLASLVFSQATRTTETARKTNLRGNDVIQTESTGPATLETAAWETGSGPGQSERPNFLGRTFVVYASIASLLLLGVILTLIFTVSIPHRIERVLNTARITMERVILSEADEGSFSIKLEGRMSEDSSLSVRVATSRGLSVSSLTFPPGTDVDVLAEVRGVGSGSRFMDPPTGLHPEFRQPEEERWWNPEFMSKLALKEDQLGELWLDPIESHGRTGLFNSSGKFLVQNQAGFHDFVKGVLRGASSIWILSGKVDVRVLGLHYKKVKFHRVLKVASVPIFSNLEVSLDEEVVEGGTTRGLGSQALKVESMRFEGDEFEVKAGLRNEGSMDVDDLGALEMEMFYQGKAVAKLDLAETPFSSGVNVVSIRGKILKDHPEELSLLLNSFLAQKSAPVKLLIRGPQGEGSVISNALNGLELRTLLDGLSNDILSNEVVASEDALLRSTISVDAAAAVDPPHRSERTILRALSILTIDLDPKEEPLWNEILFDPGDDDHTTESTPTQIPAMPLISLQRRASPDRRSSRAARRELGRASAAARKAGRRLQTPRLQTNPLQTTPLQTARALQGGSLLGNFLENLGNIRTIVAPVLRPNAVNRLSEAEENSSPNVLQGMQNLLGGIALAAADTFNMTQKTPDKLDPPSLASYTVGAGDLGNLKPTVKWKHPPDVIYQNIEKYLPQEIRVQGTILLGIWKPFDDLTLENVHIYGNLFVRPGNNNQADNRAPFVKIGRLEASLVQEDLAVDDVQRGNLASLLNQPHQPFHDREEIKVGVVLGKTDLVALSYGAVLQLAKSPDVVSLANDLLLGSSVEVMLTSANLSAHIHSPGMPVMNLERDHITEILEVPCLASISDLKIVGIGLGDTNELTIRIDVEFRSSSALMVTVGPVFLDWVFEDYHMGPLTIPEIVLQKGVNRVVMFGGLYPGPRVTIKAASLFANLMSIPELSVCVSGRSHWSEAEIAKLQKSSVLTKLTNKVTEELSAGCLNVPNPSTNRLSDAVIPFVGQIMRALLDKGRQSASVVG